jgi:toxin ParE1/3/4
VRVRWLRGALLSLRGIHARVAADDPRAASRVVARIRSAVSHLGTFPGSGRRGRVPGTREVVVPKLPYLVVYRVKGQEVEILRVFHTAMDGPLGCSENQGALKGPLGAARTGPARGRGSPA